MLNYQRVNRITCTCSDIYMESPGPSIHLCDFMCLHVYVSLLACHRIMKIRGFWPFPKKGRCPFWVEIRRTDTSDFNSWVTVLENFLSIKTPRSRKVPNTLQYSPEFRLSIHASGWFPPQNMSNNAMSVPWTKHVKTCRVCPSVHHGIMNPWWMTDSTTKLWRSWSTWRIQHVESATANSISTIHGGVMWCP